MKFFHEFIGENQFYENYDTRLKTYGINPQDLPGNRLKDVFDFLKKS